MKKGEHAMNKNKDCALYDFISITVNSWTYDRLTETEKESLLNVLKRAHIFGTYEQRFELLHDIKYSFLCALGYDKNPITWREPNPEEIPLAQP